MRRFNRLSAIALSSTMLATFGIAPAYAQDAQAEEETYENEPIIVTATLRAMDVQDIPLAVTAVAPETLERQGVADIKNLASISPSFNIQSSQTETQGTSIKIRASAPPVTTPVLKVRSACSSTVFISHVPA